MDLSHETRLSHESRPVQVWIDVDLGIAETVAYLNTIPGVRTHGSCQGTIGEGGEAPYAPYVVVTWQTPEAHARLKAEFDCEISKNSNGNWYHVHPRELYIVPFHRIRPRVYRRSTRY